MADAALVKRVIDCVMAHSQESSVWLKTQACHGRTMTTSLLRAYWGSDLPTLLGWAQFHRIVRARCKWLMRAARKTDYCDYCHLYESSILPGICKLMKQAQASLTELLPSYFHSYTEPVDGDSITKLEAMSRYIRLHSERQQADRRANLKPLGRQKLHEVEASVGHQMAWELKVAKSYHWHWQVAKRQSRAMQAALDSLSVQQVLLWSDFKQNLSAPRAHAETGTCSMGQVAWRSRAGAAWSSRRRVMLCARSTSSFCPLSSNIVPWCQASCVWRLPSTLMTLSLRQ